MRALARTNATVVWLLLSALTIVSWALGVNHAVGGGQRVLASLAILAVAIFKVRLVGLYFMELKMAPKVLRVLFEGYCAMLLVLLAAMFVFG